MLFRTFREGDVRQFFYLLIGHWNVETVADITHAVHVHFLNLVSDVFTFCGITHAVTFDGVGQDHSRFTFGFTRFFQCSVNFLRIVTTAVQSPDLLVSLVVAVNGFVHQLDQFTAGVFTQQLIPTTAPHHFDHVPASTCEDAFQFVDDLAVTGYRTIQTLQVTVDDEAQVVQLLTGRDGNRAFRFWLIHFTVAQEGVNGLLRGVFQTTVFQVLQEFSLIDRTDWTQTHRYGRELPELRHQFRVRVRRQTLTVNFLTEVVHLLFSQTTFQEGTCIDARRDVALEVHQIAAIFLVSCTEEVVEAHFVNGRRRLEGRHVATQFQVLLGCAQNGHDGVPADSRTDTAFQIQIARVFRFVFDGNRVYVVASPCT